MSNRAQRRAEARQEQKENAELRASGYFQHIVRQAAIKQRKKEQLERNGITTEHLSGLTYNELKKAIGGTCSGHIRGYLEGKYSPSVEKIQRMQELTSINPDAFDLPIADALKCVERMRELFRQGHIVSEFSKALRPLDYKMIDKLIGGQRKPTHLEELRAKMREAMEKTFPPDKRTRKCVYPVTYFTYIHDMGDHFVGITHAGDEVILPKQTDEGGA